MLMLLTAVHEGIQELELGFDYRSGVGFRRMLDARLLKVQGLLPAGARPLERGASVHDMP